MQRAGERPDDTMRESLVRVALRLPGTNRKGVRRIGVVRAYINKEEFCNSYASRQGHMVLGWSGGAAAECWYILHGERGYFFLQRSM